MEGETKNQVRLCKTIFSFSLDLFQICPKLKTLDLSLVLRGKLLQDKLLQDKFLQDKLLQDKLCKTHQIKITLGCRF